MLTFAKKYHANTYSQFGCDGIIAECLKRIDPQLKVAVEFGGADGFFCSNTARLREEEGWVSHMYDLEAVPPFVEKKMITPDNINEIPKCSVLSIDVDGNDYNIWEAYKGRPDIVIIEINSSIPPTNNGPISDRLRGTSYAPMVELGISKGYFLVCHTGNCIFVHNGYRWVFPEIEGDGLSNYELYFNTAHL